LFSYILSKVWLVGILAIYQGLVWTTIHVAATGMAAGLQVLIPYAITIFLVALIGGILGLIVSSFSRTGMMTSWLLLLTVPQLILSGAIMPLANLSFVFNFLSPLNPSSYALDSLLAIGGYGQGLNGTLFSDWLILAILSLGLVLLLMGIQRRAADART
jgi:ABC-type multidrug transport system permease subunit